MAVYSYEIVMILTKRFKNAIAWLGRNRKKLIKLLAIAEDDSFDYPDYVGMPARISHRLTSDEVDLIQDYWYYYLDDSISMKEIRRMMGI